MLHVETTTALSGFELTANLDVAPGECLAIVGPSGAGKTTLLRVAAGLLHPAVGRVRCGDHVWLDTAAGVDLPPEQRRVGYVFQEYALFSHLRAWQNVAYGMCGVARAERRERAHALLDRFGLADRAQARPGTLSGGERQRVALARALAVEPTALLLDEPLSALDVQTRAAGARELLATLRSCDVPTLLVTHDFAEAALFGNRIAVLDQGGVVQFGTGPELAAAPATPFVGELVGGVLLSGPAGPVCLFPWELRLVPASCGAMHRTDQVPATIDWITPIGSRVRVGLITREPSPRQVLVESELTHFAELGCGVGVQVIVTWDPTTARPVPALRFPPAAAQSP